MKKYRIQEEIVLDTNVLISGIIKPYNSPAKILNLIVEGQLILVLDARIFDEYSHVLKRKRFSFPTSLINVILSYIKAKGRFITPNVVDIPLPDPSDLPFVEVALNARVPIITGNIKHFKIPGLEVFTPSAFLQKRGMLRIQ